MKPITQKNRPIGFVLTSGTGFSVPVILNIRPEELTRTSPTRATAHQTLGRTVKGWVDNFGEGLPTVTIAGHTGWRPSGLVPVGGEVAFEMLYNLVVKQYNAEKQKAIDSGMDPETVKLIMVDTLDLFVWNVIPINFQLRRSKNRPLLYQYNIQMQAISKILEIPAIPSIPISGITGGLSSLSSLIG